MSYSLRYDGHGDKIWYAIDSSDKEFLAIEANLEKIISFEEARGNRVTWWEINNGERVYAPRIQSILNELDNEVTCK